ncbi:ABC transporter ATP-binding protein [Corynebacterium sp. NPDC060344]|uniref:ABC transporter ATP-binding protein n=1 Tax=Corynebacterium sp. NPDC060344 TaxID=3347101 RepID=UPI003664C193
MTAEVHAGTVDKRTAANAALGELLRPIRGRLLAGRILGAASALLSIAPYVALVRLGEILLEAHRAGVPVDSADTDPVVKFLLATFLGQLALLFAALALTHFADLALGSVLRRRILDRISRAPLSWFSDATSGQVRKAIQDDTRTLHILVAHAPVETTVAIITPVMLLGYAFTVDWRLGLLALATLPLYALVQAWGMRGMGTKTAEMDTHLGRVSSTAVEFADGIAVVKAFGRTGEAHRRYRDAARSFSDFYLTWVGPLMRVSALSESVVSVALLVLVNVAGGAALVAAGIVSPVQVLTTTLIALVVPGAVQKLGTTAWSYQLAGNAALRITEILDGPELSAPDAGRTREGSLSDDAGAPPRAPAPRDNGVEFRGVGFSYGNTRALSDVTLRLAPGTVTALVGPSGSGKSTLATMVARFQDPDEGSVEIGGVDIRHLPTAELYRTVSFVLQDPQLPRISIRDNIALAKPGATDEEIIAAARSARIADDVEALPRGLDAVVGEDAHLSGGQCQRIAIARALLADAPILILDEATAATDPDCEAEIQAALNRLVVGRTVLVIGHKPESVRGVDQIALLVDGRIADVLSGDAVTAGAVHELMNRKAPKHV